MTDRPTDRPTILRISYIILPYPAEFSHTVTLTVLYHRSLSFIGGGWQINRIWGVFRSIELFLSHIAVVNHDRSLAARTDMNQAPFIDLVETVNRGRSVG